MALLKGLLQNGCYRFYIQNKYSDITLITADKIRFQCHKLVLAAVSEVFEKQFLIDNLDVREIELKNINAEAFTAFINCVYHDDELKIDSVDVAIEMYKFGYEFKLINLLMVLQSFFVKISPVTGLKCINALKCFGSENVLEHCDKVFSSDLKEVLESDAFLNCSLQAVAKFTTYEDVNVSELELFKAIEKWVDHKMECEGEDFNNLKMFFDEILKNIRFLSMTPAEFLSGPMKSDLLTDKDKLSLLSNITLPDSVPFPEKFSKSKLKREVNFFEDIMSYVKSYYKIITWDTLNICKFNFNYNKEYRSEKIQLKETENEFIIIANLHRNEENNRCISVSIQSCNNENLEIQDCEFGLLKKGETLITFKRLISVDNFDIGPNEVKKFEELSLEELEEDEYYCEDCLRLFVEIT